MPPRLAHYLPYPFMCQVESLVFLTGDFMMKLLNASLLAVVLFGGMIVTGCETSHTQSTTPTWTGGTKTEETTTTKNPITGDTSTSHTETKN